MNKTKHTLVPWLLNSNNSSEVCYLGVPIAKALDNCDSYEETQANARLIAAAPELLEVCKLALIDGNVNNFIKSYLESVIAKATGSSDTSIESVERSETGGKS